MLVFLAEKGAEDAAALAGLRSLFGGLGGLLGAIDRGACIIDGWGGGSVGIKRLLWLLRLGAGGLDCSCSNCGWFG